jgi:hypothetical protein
MPTVAPMPARRLRNLAAMFTGSGALGGAEGNCCNGFAALSGANEAWGAPHHVRMTLKPTRTHA